MIRRLTDIIISTLNLGWGVSEGIGYHGTGSRDQGTNRSSGAWQLDERFIAQSFLNRKCACAVYPELRFSWVSWWKALCAKLMWTKKGTVINLTERNLTG